MPLFYQDQLLAARVFDKLARLDYLEEALSAIRQDDYQRFMKVCNSAMHKQLSENVLASVWTQVEDFFMKRVSFGNTRYATTLIDWHELSELEGWKFSTKWEVEESGPPQVRDDPGEDPYPRGVKVTVTASKTIDGVPVVLQFWFYFEDAAGYEDGDIEAAEPNNAMVEMPAGHGTTKLVSLKDAARDLVHDFYELQDWLPQEAVDEYELAREQYHRYNPRRPKWAAPTLSYNTLIDLSNWKVNSFDTELIEGRENWSWHGPESVEPAGLTVELDAGGAFSGVPIRFKASVRLLAEFDDHGFDLSIEDTTIDSLNVDNVEVLLPGGRIAPLKDVLEDVAGEFCLTTYMVQLKNEIQDALDSLRKYTRRSPSTRRQFNNPEY